MQSTSPRTDEVYVNRETTARPSRFSQYLPSDRCHQLRYRAIYDRLKRAIINGDLKDGSRVPSIRALSDELNLSRATIARAYALLAGEDLLVMSGQSGTRVSYVARGHSSSLRQKVDNASTTRKTSIFEHRGGGEFVPPPSVASQLGPKPFQTCVPAIDIFPRARWLKISQRILRDKAEVSQVAADVHGHEDLRSAICGYVGVSRGVRCRPEQVIITNGYRQSLSLIANALLDDEHSVVTEDPCFASTYKVLERIGVRAVPTAVDEDGICVPPDDGPCGNVRMIITTPARQVPLGVAMSMQRRHDVIRWARDTDSWILEDDNESEFCAASRNASTIFNLDRYSRTIFLGNFNNVLHPNIRTSYIIVPDRILPGMLNTANILLDGMCSVQQKVLAEFITSGALALHLNRARRVYNERRGMMIAALKECFGSRIEIRDTSGGLQLVCSIESSARDIDICASAARHGLAISSLSENYIAAPPADGILVGFANFTTTCQIKQQLSLLKSLIPT